MNRTLGRALRNIFVVCLIHGFAFAQDIDSNLEAYLSFDEGSGTVATDSSGNDRNAEFRNGSATWIAGKRGSALEFDGDDDLTIVGWDGVLGDTPRTITYWVRTDWISDQSNGIVGWGFSTADGTKWHTRLNQNAGNGTVGAIRTEIQGTYIIGSTIINDGEWHHVASVLVDGGFLIEDIDHYIDGELEVASGNGNPDVIIDTPGFDGGGTEVEIGSRLQGTAQQYYIGAIDEIRIHSRALSQEEIQTLMALGNTAVNDWEIFE